MSQQALAQLTVETLRRNRATILRLARRHGASNVRIFGSVVRGAATPDSDLDLLVAFEPSRSLLDRVALIQDLEDAFGVSVDVVTEKSLHPLIRDEVIRQAQPI